MSMKPLHTVIVTSVFLIFAGRSSIAAQTNDLDVLKNKYTDAVARIETERRTDTTSATAAYGKSLDTALQVLKAKGDLDGFLEVQNEKKRFATEPVVLQSGATKRQPLLEAAIRDYHEAIRRAESQRVDRLNALSQQYIARLESLMRSLVQRDKIAEAQEVAAEMKIVRVNSAPVATVAPPTSEPPPTHSNSAPQVDSEPTAQVNVAPPPEVPPPALSSRVGGSALILSGPQGPDEVTLTKGQTATLRGSYSVPAGKTLTVEAGAIVKAEKGAFLQIFGNLDVKGAQDAPVVFCGEKKTTGFWKGICGEPQSLDIEFALIRDAQTAVESPKGSMRNCIITGNTTGIRSKNCQVANCIFEKNAWCAIHSDFGTTTIENCTCRANGSNPTPGGGLCGLWRGEIVFGSANGKFVMRKSIVADNKGTGVGDFRNGSLVEDCIVENNKPADFCVSESNLQVSNCWMGEAVQRVVEQKGYGANLSNVIDIHDGRKGTVVFTPGPKSRPKDCGATLNLKLPSGF